MRAIKMMVLGALATAAFMAPAQAATYLWNFTDSSNVLVASGSLTTAAPSALVPPSSVVTGGSGSVYAVDGFTADSFTIYPTSATLASYNTSPLGSFYYDNLLYTSTVPYVDNYGLLFTSSVTGLEYNIFNGASGYLPGNYPGADAFYSSPAAGSYTNTSGTFAITAVPEPATWAMFLLGFAFIGWSLRGRSSGLNAIAA